MKSNVSLPRIVLYTQISRYKSRLINRISRISHYSLCLRLHSIDRNQIEGIKRENYQRRFITIQGRLIEKSIIYLHTREYPATTVETEQVHKLKGSRENQSIRVQIERTIKRKIRKNPDFKKP